MVEARINSPPGADEGEFTITLFSFGYKHGAPEADMVFDVRFLPNPYWVPELKEQMRWQMSFLSC